MIEQLLQNQAFVGISGAGIIGGLVYFLRNAPGRMWSLFMDLFSTEVEVKSSDPAFWWLVVWLTHTRYASKARRLRLSTRNEDGRGSRHAIARSADQKASYILSPGSGIHILRHAGTFVWINRSEQEAKDAFQVKETISLRVLSSKRQIIHSILDEAKAIVEDQNSNMLVIHASAYGEWYVATRKPLRSPESVVLAEGVMNAMISDLELFLQSREWYAERGIPWRRGYLLDGPPGCGKTSIASVIASKLKTGVAVISLSSVGSDGDLQNLLRAAPDNCLILMEDIDATFAGRERKNENECVTFGGLLNAIDGIAAQEGRVIFMTTNHKEKLDPALIRPGRADRHFHIGLATADQAERMFLRFFPEERTRAREFGVDAVGSSLSEIQGHLLQSRADPTAARSWSDRSRRARPQLIKPDAGQPWQGG